VAYRDAVLADAPIGYWELQETSGTTAADSAGANPGTYTGGYTLAGDGPGGGLSVAFDGSTGYVTVPNHSSMNTNSAMAIEFWMKSSTAGAFDQVVNRGVLDTNGWAARINNDATGMLVSFHGLTSVNAGPLGFIPTDGRWHYIVGTYDGARIKAYRDGVLGDDWASTGTITATAAAFEIARISAQDYYPGSVAHVALYSSALSLAQVENHWNAGTRFAGGNAYDDRWRARPSQFWSGTSTLGTKRSVYPEDSCDGGWRDAVADNRTRT